MQIKIRVARSKFLSNKLVCAKSFTMENNMKNLDGQSSEMRDQIKEIAERNGHAL